MRNILWIHTDAFRSDARKLIVDREKEDLFGFRFLDDNFYKLSNCYSQATSTIYSIASYLTGTYPFVNGVLNNDIGAVRSDIKFIGEILREHGYHSKAYITTGPKHDKNFIRMGIDRAFDEYEFLHSPNGFIEEQMLSSELIKYRGKDIIGRCNEGKNMFTFVTLLDMHVWDGRYKDGKWDEYYKGAVETNQFFSKILPEIDLDKTLVVVNGDHGWKFAFDQEQRNAYFGFNEISGYEPLIKVSAYFSSFPSSFNHKCRLVDLMPTILHSLQIDFYSYKINGIPLQYSEWDCMFGKTLPIYSECGMVYNTNRNVDIEGYKRFIKECKNDKDIMNALKKLEVPVQNNFSLIFDDGVIMFNKEGIPYGYFSVEGNIIDYSENKLGEEEKVLSLCEKAKKFIEDNKI